MKCEEHVVFVVDDDAAIREALSDLFSSFDMRAIMFNCAADYVAYPKPDIPGCLLLDVQLPDINGLDFQCQSHKEELPEVVFITGHGDIPSSVRAIKAGAVDFLTKPFDAAELMLAVKTAISRDGDARQKRSQLNESRRRFLSLTPREREVLPLVVGGLLNKQAGAQLGISEITLQIHRSRIMQKMKADSLAELVRMALQLKVPLPKSRRRQPADPYPERHALPERHGIAHV